MAVKAEAFASVLPGLCGLRHLAIRRNAITSHDSGWAPLWRALAAGACPRLETLRTAVGGERQDFEVPLQLSALATALEARRGLGIEPLGLLRLWDVSDEPVEGLSRIFSFASESAMQIELSLPASSSQLAQLVDCLQRSPAFRLRSLQVLIPKTGIPDRARLPDGSALLLALVDSGKASRRSSVVAASRRQVAATESADPDVYWLCWLLCLWIQAWCLGWSACTSIP